jgi:acyl-coenzyme A thioesterase PaaI-like protein
MDDQQPSGPPESADAAQERLVAEMRRLIELSVTADAPADTLRRAALHVAEAVKALTPHRGDGRRRPSRQPGSSDPAALMPFDPMIGPLSPIAPPIRYRWEPPTAIGEVVFTAAYEGPPGCVHGGVIAAAFDQAFNVANLMLGTAGPTASLQLSYRRPTPLQVPLRFEAWQDRVEGRRVYTRGRLLAGDRMTVEAEGLFVLVPIDRILRMIESEPEDDAAS